MVTRKKSKSKVGVKEMLGGMVIPKFAGYFLIACIVVLGLFLIGIFKPFITTLILAAILATAFSPFYQIVLKIFKGNSLVASLVTCFLIVILIIVPLTLFVIFLGQQAHDAFDFIQDQIRNGVVDDIIVWVNNWLSYLRNLLGGFVDIESIDIESLDIKSTVANIAQIVTGTLVIKTTDLVMTVVWMLFSFLVLVFAMFYLFRDADKIIERIMTLSPLPREHEKRVFDKFKEISKATLYGIFLTAVAQGIIGGIGFAIAGIPNALFWGTTIAVFSLVPVIGTATVWLPAALILLAGGYYVQGVFLLLWGGLLVSTVDNVLRTYFIGVRAKMNQLLMFLAIIGGVLFFKGLIGVIFGPLILSLFIAFVHIYEMEYDTVLHGKDK